MSALQSNHPNLELLQLGGTGNLGGDLADLPRALTTFSVTRTQGMYTGTIGQLPATLTNVSINNINDISGEISSLAASIESLSISGGSNTVSGTIGEIPETLTRLTLNGQNTLAGNIENLHVDMLSLSLAGANEVSGDISLLQNNGTVSINVSSRNTVDPIVGEIANIPQVITSLSLTGTNVLSGNIQDLHASMRTLQVFGTNTIGGNIDAIQSDNGLSLSVYGNNTIAGSIAGIPQTLTFIRLGGSNSVSGNIQDLHTDMRYVDIRAVNGEITGDLGLIRSDALQFLAISGNNTINQFSDPASWNPERLYNLGMFADSSEGFFSSAEVDAILAFLDATITQVSSNSAQISLRRPGDQPRTAASNNAAASLEAKGFRVLTADIPVLQ